MSILDWARKVSRKELRLTDSSENRKAMKRAYGLRYLKKNMTNGKVENCRKDDVYDYRGVCRGIFRASSIRLG